MHRPLHCLPILLAVLSPLARAAQPLTMHVEPARPYIEHVGDQQALNFELVLRNPGTTPLVVDRIQMTALDAGGHVLLRRFVDDNGVRPSVAVLGERTVPPGGTLAVFNPFPRLAGELPLATLRYEVALSDGDAAVGNATLTVIPRDYRDASRMRLPLDGRMINYDGHDFLGHHRRFDTHAAPIARLGFRANFMRYSYDLVPVDGNGAMYRGRFEDNKAWFGFGRPILAAADGTVVAAVGDRPDNRRFRASRLAADPWELFGNYVVIDQGHGEYAVYAHARQGSLTVHPGQRVRRGQPIAGIGASGSAFFPHLHFQLQAGRDTSAEGLPSYFDGFARVIGERLVPRQGATIDTGEIVQAD